MIYDDLGDDLGMTTEPLNHTPKPFLVPLLAGAEGERRDRGCLQVHQWKFMCFIFVSFQVLFCLSCV